MRLRDSALADEFDRTLSTYFREWEDEREDLRLRKFWIWAWGGSKDESGKSTRSTCDHPANKLKPHDKGGMYCSVCGMSGIY